ncbi:hypothetical protein [Lacticaseibacillus parakribbianus]|uniref:hypothetical protein n=1 Tax=Lacticaseibacillus parakribbianus TaxID=2970927 RepID=UPI0021CAF3BC|nr:hypothetical protein [Lacticaseibacillus parakribbianus]
MTRKIVSLESLIAMDVCQNDYDGHEYNCTRYISVGHPYGEQYTSDDMDGKGNIIRVENHTDRDVVSIEYARNVICGNPGAYIVKLKDGCKLSLPENSFIAETVEVKD